MFAAQQTALSGRRDCAQIRGRVTIDYGNCFLYSKIETRERDLNGVDRGFPIRFMVYVK